MSHCNYYFSPELWTLLSLFLSILWVLLSTNLYGVNVSKFCTKATWWHAFSYSVPLAAIEFCAFVGLFISDTAAPLLSPLTTALASSDHVLLTQTRHKCKELRYWSTGSYDARAVIIGDRSRAAIRGHFEHTVYSFYHIPGVSSESVYIIGRVHLIIYVYI